MGRQPTNEARVMSPSVMLPKRFLYLIETNGISTARTNMTLKEIFLQPMGMILRHKSKWSKTTTCNLSAHLEDL